MSLPPALPIRRASAMKDESFLTTEELLEYLQVNLRTVYRLIKAGRIPAVRVGRQWRFRKSDIDAWLDAQTVSTVPAKPDPDRRPPSPGSSRPRVLVVDDEESILDLLTRALTSAHYDVDVAPDGAVALDRLDARTYDLVITDLRNARHGRPRVRRRGPPPPRQAAGRGHHRLLVRGQCDRGRQPRRLRVRHEAVQDSRVCWKPPRRRSTRDPALTPATPIGPNSRSMIQLSSVHKAFGARVLLDDVSWQVGTGDRIGVCGPNGAGKTTLLRMMAGLDEPDAGAVTRPHGMTVGYLPQDGLTHRGRTLFEEASLAFSSLLEMQQEMHDLESRLGDTTIPEPEHESMLARYSELQEAFRDRGGYDIEAKVTSVLQGLGFGLDTFGHATESFSGGWQMRIALAKLLLQEPGLLLLDEPTNHLDLDARNWLEDFLRSYSGSVVLVSHDRFFLDTVVTAIVEVGLRRLTTYRGGYSAYLTERDARLERLREQKRRQDEEVARIQAFIDRFRYQATKAAQVQSRVKMLEKITPVEVPPERKRVHFTFPSCARSGRAVIELRHARKCYGDLTVFDDANVLVERGDRVALVGPNGAGKSTLMRMLSGVESPDSGERVEGGQLVAQYFAQDEATRLDGSRTVYETLSDGSPVHMVPQIRNILGGFLFTGDDIYKKVSVLSGGERTRLAVARMLLRPSNTLLLDEPTNHLDIDSTDVLLDALADYRRHAHLRLARPLLRRPARHESDGGRRGRGRRLPRDLRGVPLEQAAAGRRPGSRPPTRPAPSPEKPRRSAADHRRRQSGEPAPGASAQDAPEPDWRAGGTHREPGDSRPRSGSRDAEAGLLPGRVDGQGDDRPSPGAHVGGRRSHEPMGSPAERSR